MRALFVLSFLLMPLAAAAACPGPADVRSGIVLVQNWPVFRRADFESTPRGVMETRVDRTGGGEAQSLIWYAHGLAPHLERSLRGGERAVRYHGDARALDRLRELGEVALTATETGQDGRNRELTLRAAYLGSDEYELAECRYAVWQLRLERLAAGQPPAITHVSYTPDLDLVLAASTVTPDGKDILNFRYNWIGTKADVRR